MILKNVSKGIQIVLLVGAIIFIVVSAKKILDFLRPTVFPEGSSPPVVSVTPISITSQVKHHLPKNQTAISQINLPHLKSLPGIISTQHIVITNQGNTLVVATNKTDWGLRFDPKIFLGYSDDIFLGIGANVFTVWKFNLDLLIATNIGNEDSLSRVYLGAGISYQIYRNTFLGIAVFESTELKTIIGTNLNLRF